MKILVTGGAGYIGSHCCLEFLKSGHEILVIDNLSSGHPEAIKRVKKLSEKDYGFCQLDLRDESNLYNVLKNFLPDLVVHLAGSKSVPESVTYPILYYENNVSCTISLLKVMNNIGCSSLIFSSSATVYGYPNYSPIDENHPTIPQNPYGRSKLMIEEILKDWSHQTISKKVLSLRYFNPVGAHPSGLIGEDPNGIPGNLMPYLSQVAYGHRDVLKIFGSDYNTRDGTGERDYIHVCDVATAHLSAVEKLRFLPKYSIFNIGTGIGTTVKELVSEFSLISSKKIVTELSPRRPGDVERAVTNPKKANQDLNWFPKFTIKQMCKDFWRWQTMNPRGFNLLIKNSSTKIEP